MADLFLKVEGIPGESTDEAHTGEIDLLGWSWAVARSDSRAVAAIGRATASGGLENILGGRQPRGRTAVADLTVDKRVDRASAPLILASLNGTIIPQVVLVVRASGGGAPVDFLTLTMKGVSIISVNQLGSPDEHLETVAIRFAEITYEHRTVAEQGGAGTTTDFTWLVASGTEG